jgi:hypothetical protein
MHQALEEKSGGPQRGSRSQSWRGLAALGLLALSLTACEKAPPNPIWPPEPQVKPVTSDSAPQPQTALLPSVPAADEVINTPATAAKPDPTAGRSNSAMSRAQESSAMPMPGQNNDHSAPVNPPKPSSAPRRD